MHRASCARTLAAFVLVAFLITPARSGPIAANLRADEDLAAKIRLRGDRMAVHQVVKALGEATDLNMAAEAELANQKVRLTGREKTCVEVMERMARQFGGIWIKTWNGLWESYLLMTDRRLAERVARYGEGRSTDREQRAFCRSLLPAQLARLRRQVPLRFEEFTPAQKRLALVIATNYYLSQPESYSRTILRGEGLRVELLKPVMKDAKGVVVDVPRALRGQYPERVILEAPLMYGGKVGTGEIGGGEVWR